MASQKPATEYFCPNCPEKLLVYADRSQTIEDVYLPAEKRIVTVIFDVCYCQACDATLWIQRDVPPAS